MVSRDRSRWDVGRRFVLIIARSCVQTIPTEDNPEFLIQARVNMDETGQDKIRTRVTLADGFGGEEEGGHCE